MARSKYMAMRNSGAVCTRSNRPLPRGNPFLVLDRNKSLEQPAGLLDLPRELRDEIYQAIIFSAPLKKVYINNHVTAIFTVEKHMYDHTHLNPPPQQTKGRVAVLYLSRQVHQEYRVALEKHVLHRFVVSPAVPTHLQYPPDANDATRIRHLPASAARRVAIQVCSQITCPVPVGHEESFKQELADSEGFQGFISQLLSLHKVENIGLAFHEHHTYNGCRDPPPEPVFQAVESAVQKLPRLRRYFINYGWSSRFAHRDDVGVPWESDSVIRYHNAGLQGPPHGEWPEELHEIAPNYTSCGCSGGRRPCMMCLDTV